MIRIIIFALAVFGLYTLFFKDKRIIIEDRKPNHGNKKFTEYEEL